MCNEVENKIGWKLSTKVFFLVLCTRWKLGEKRVNIISGNLNCHYYFCIEWNWIFFDQQTKTPWLLIHCAARKKKTLISEQPTVDSRFSRQLVYCLRLFYYNNTSTQKSKSIHSLHTMLYKWKNSATNVWVQLHQKPI